MTKGLHSLPIIRSPVKGESGMGLLLRTASANGLSLHALRDLCGISTVRILYANDAVHLAPVLGMPVAELEGLLMAKGQHMGTNALRYLEHLFVRTGFLRTVKPQICPICIHRGGYCRAVWDCVFYTDCHVHRIPMVDRCGACQLPLSWYRPAVDVCRCKAYLTGESGEIQGQDSKSLWLSAWIANLFDDHVDPTAMSSAYPNWLTELSIDGLCSIVQAFGVCSTAYQKVQSNSQRKGRGTGHWRVVAERGLSRLDQLVSRHLDLSGLSDLVWEGGLEGVALRCTQQTDRQVAQMLMQKVFGKNASARFGSHGAPLSQLALF